MTAQFGLKLRSAGRVFFDGYHLTTLRHELQRDGFANPAAGTGDYRHLVVKSHDLTAPAVRP